MNEDLVQKAKYLRLGGLIAHWNQYLKLAAEKRYSHGKLLAHIVEEEYRIKRNNARIQRLNKARIPERLLIETFPWEKQPKLNKKKILAIYDSGEYIKNSRNIIWLGPTGCGKTGLATAFLIQAIEQGHTGRHVLFAELVDELYRSVADHSEAKILKKYLAYDILCIDEIGYYEVEPVQVGLFFTLMHKRHKKKPTLITSNLGFSEWTTFLKNDHLTAALIDRLTENSYVVNMKNCRSLRAKLAQNT